MTHSMREAHRISQNGNANECFELLQYLCENSSDAIVIYDRTGRIASINRTAEAMFGYSANQVIAKPINLLLPTVNLDSEPSEFLTTMTVGQTHNGRTLHVEMMLIDFYADQEAYYLSVIRDMSASYVSCDVALSPRQLQVLKLVVQGYTSREIGDQLTISIKTVETHRANIMTKLGVRNVSSLVRYAIEQNII